MKAFSAFTRGSFPAGFAWLRGRWPFGFRTSRYGDFSGPSRGEHSKTTRSLRKGPIYSMQTKRPEMTSMQSIWYLVNEIHSVVNFAQPRTCMAGASHWPQVLMQCNYNARQKCALMTFFFWKLPDSDLSDKTQNWQGGRQALPERNESLLHKMAAWFWRSIEFHMLKLDLS